MATLGLGEYAGLTDYVYHRAGTQDSDQTHDQAITLADVFNSL
ncbi:MAG: hypothetical protein WBN88_16970 [Anderseniella sp.]